jgi:gamma-aminobutyric acid type B receptor
VFVSWTWTNRKSRVVAASQPEFLYLILAGTTIFSSSIITTSIDDERHTIASCNIACNLNVWLLSVGFTIIFAALYSKARRINIISKESSRLRRVTVMPKDVILPFFLLLMVNVVILITWMIHDPREYKRSVHPGTDDWNREFSFYGRCISLHAEIYFSLILVVNMIALILALYETYKTRNLRTEFDESAYIGIVFICIRKFKKSSFTHVHHNFSISNNVICYTVQAAVIGIPVAAVTSDRPRVAIPVIQVVIFFTCMATLLFIFVPKILSHRKKKGERKNRMTLTQQYLTMRKLESEHVVGNQFSPREVTRASGLRIRKFEPRLMITLTEPEIVSKKGADDDTNEKTSFVNGQNLSAKNDASS